MKHIIQDYMVTRGHLYVFEGADGSGKSALSAEFARLLNEMGHNPKLLTFPGKTRGTLGELVYRIHHEPKDFGIGELTEAGLQALHIAAHLDTIQTTIIPALERGECVVLDRFWWSTWVYGLVGCIQRNVLHALIDVERLAWGQWQPTSVFYIARSQPLRPEPMATWQQLKTAYEELVIAEHDKYPIYVIQNETTQKAALDQVLTRVVTS